MPQEMQTTLNDEIRLSGSGIFTGSSTSMRILPAIEGNGITFQRLDLPQSGKITALASSVTKTPRCTCIGNAKAEVMMVEHLLSALYASEVDNAHIEIDGPEVPGFDGSSREIVAAIESVGLKIQKIEKEELIIQKPCFWSEGDVHLVALPSDSFQLSYTLHYPSSNLIGTQYYSMILTQDRYREEISSARTFSLYEEIEPLIQKGLILGGGLESAVVIQNNQVANPEGLRYSNEMVRHKVLDLIGDLSLVGKRLKGHILAICSGHRSNVAFAKMLLKTLKREEACV